MHQFLGFELTWDKGYRYRLFLRGCKRFLGVAPFPKAAVTPQILLSIFPLLDFDIPWHAALWALCLVAFYSFLRKSNLVVDRASFISSKSPLCSDLLFSSHGATLCIRDCQRQLRIPLPLIPGSPLCPVTALRYHFRANQLGSSLSIPLFSIVRPDSGHSPVTYRNFSGFIKTSIRAIGLDSHQFSSHSSDGEALHLRSNVVCLLSLSNLKGIGAVTHI